MAETDTVVTPALITVEHLLCLCTTFLPHTLYVFNLTVALGLKFHVCRSDYWPLFFLNAPKNQPNNAV